MMFGSRRKKLVVSEADIETALAHLRMLPYQTESPMNWERQSLINQLREIIQGKPKINEYYSVAPGVFAIIKPFGVDLISRGEPDGDGRLQVWLLVRSLGTDPTRLTALY